MLLCTLKSTFHFHWQISKPGCKVLNNQLQTIKIFNPIYTFLKCLLQVHSNWHISKRNPEKVDSIHLNRANSLHLIPKNKSRKWVTKNQSYSIYQKHAYILKNDCNLHSWFIYHCKHSYFLCKWFHSNSYIFQFSTCTYLF